MYMHIYSIYIKVKTYMYVITYMYTHTFILYIHTLHSYISYIPGTYKHT